MTKEQKFLIKLIKSNIDGTQLPITDNLNLNELYDFSFQNQFEHIVYPFLSEKGLHDEKIPVMHLFHQKYGHAIRRDGLQDMEAKQISDELFNNKVPHIFLKGTVVKKYYPNAFLRRSGDIDLLIRKEDRQKADIALKNLGYTCEIGGRDVEDVYKKGKSIVEIHYKLTYEDDISYDFCEKVWEHSASQDGFRYETECEYIYVYLLSHLRKHVLTAGGGGVKLILDLYVMNKNLNMDKDKLNLYTKLAKISNLREYAEKLSLKWFGGEEYSDKNVEMLENLILNSGAHGDYGNYVDITLSKNKGASLLKMIFPSAKDMKFKYPVLKKRPYLLPLSYIWRVRDAKMSHTKEILKSSVSGLNKEEAKELSRFCSDISQ